MSNKELAEELHKPIIRKFEKRKVHSTINAFQKILDGAKRKPNKIWVDKGSEF